MAGGNSSNAASGGSSGKRPLGRRTSLIVPRMDGGPRDEERLHLSVLRPRPAAAAAAAAAAADSTALNGAHGNVVDDAVGLLSTTKVHSRLKSMQAEILGGASPLVEGAPRKRSKAAVNSPNGDTGSVSPSSMASVSSIRSIAVRRRRSRQRRDSAAGSSPPGSPRESVGGGGYAESGEGLSSSSRRGSDCPFSPSSSASSLPYLPPLDEYAGGSRSMVLQGSPLSRVPSQMWQGGDSTNAAPFILAGATGSDGGGNITTAMYAAGAACAADTAPHPHLTSPAPLPVADDMASAGSASFYATRPDTPLSPAPAPVKIPASVIRHMSLDAFRSLPAIFGRYPRRRMPFEDFTREVVRLLGCDRVRELGLTIKVFADLFVQMDVQRAGYISFEQFADYVSESSSGVGGVDEGGIGVDLVASAASGAGGGSAAVELDDVAVWFMQQGSGTPHNMGDHVEHLRVLQNGRFVACRKSHGASVFGAADMRLLRRFGGSLGSFLDIVVVPQLKRIVALCADRTIVLMDNVSLIETKRLYVPSQQLTGAWDPKHCLLWTGGMDGGVRAWNLEKGDEVYVLDDLHSDWVSHVLFVRELDSVITCSLDKTIKVIAADSGTYRRTLEGHSQSVYAMAFCSQTRALVSVGAERDAYVWNPYIGGSFQRLTGHERPLMGVCLVEGRGCAITADVGSVIRVWDVAISQCIQVIGGVMPKPLPLHGLRSRN